MVTFLRRNLAWMLLAMILSTGLWLIVTVEQNPDDRIAFSSISIQVRDVPDGLAVANDLEKVRVTVIAPQDVIPQLRQDQIRVELDASNATVGSQAVPVNVTVEDSRARIESVDPEVVFLRLDEVRSKEVQVRVNTVGIAAVGYVARGVRVTPATVVVRGPQSVVDQVSAVSVDVNLEGQRANVNQALTPVAVSASGSVVERVTIEPERVLVEVPVEQQVSYKTVPVIPKVAGSVALGYQIVGVQVDPQTVTILGDPAVLSGLETIQTRPIDVTGAEGDVAVSAEANLPQGAALNLNQTILVRVIVQPDDGSKVIEVAPTVSELPSQLSAQIEPPSVQVTVAGPLPLLSRLKPEDLAVVIDGSTLGEGSHTVQPVLRVPNLIRVVSFSPTELRVTVRQLE